MSAIDSRGRARGENRNEQRIRDHYGRTGRRAPCRHRPWRRCWGTRQHLDGRTSGSMDPAGRWGRSADCDAGEFVAGTRRAQGDSVDRQRERDRPDQLEHPPASELRACRERLPGCQFPLNIDPPFSTEIMQNASHYTPLTYIRQWRIVRLISPSADPCASSRQRYFSNIVTPYFLFGPMARYAPISPNNRC